MNRTMTAANKVNNPLRTVTVKIVLRRTVLKVFKYAACGFIFLALAFYKTVN
jgi:hypothetical protein